MNEPPQGSIVLIHGSARGMAIGTLRAWQKVFLGPDLGAGERVVVVVIIVVALVFGLADDDPVDALRPQDNQLANDTCAAYRSLVPSVNACFTAAPCDAVENGRLSK